MHIDASMLCRFISYKLNLFKLTSAIVVITESFVVFVVSINASVSRQIWFIRFHKCPFNERDDHQQEIILLAWRRAKRTWKCLTKSVTLSVLPLAQIEPPMTLIKLFLLHRLKQMEILVRVWSARLFEHLLSGAGIDLQTFFLVTAWMFLNRSRSSVVFEVNRYVGVRCAWNGRCNTPMRNGLTPVGATAFARLL